MTKLTFDLWLKILMGDRHIAKIRKFIWRWLFIEHLRRANWWSLWLVLLLPLKLLLLSGSLLLLLEHLELLLPAAATASSTGAAWAVAAALQRSKYHGVWLCQSCPQVFLLFCPVVFIRWAHETRCDVKKTTLVGWKLSKIFVTFFEYPARSEETRKERGDYNHKW